MGGFGSGNRWRVGAKELSDDIRKLDVRYLNRIGALVPSIDFEWYGDIKGKRGAAIRIYVELTNIVLMFKQQCSGHGKLRYSHQIVELEWTECHLGGSRPWFLCPGQGCGRRVAILYDNGEFICRHCRRVAYACQRQDYVDRLASRVNKIRSRLGWQQGVLIKPIRQKPKGMHWKTYEEFTNEHDKLLERCLSGMVSMFS